MMRCVVVLLVCCLTACIAAPEPTFAPTTEPATPTRTLVPTSTFTLLPPQPTVLGIITETPDPAAQATAAAVSTSQVSLIETDLQPPIRITLPDNWGFAHAALPLSEGASVGLVMVVPTEEFVAGEPSPTPQEGSIGFLPFSVYRGPVTGGTGNITLLWAFHNITSTIPGQEAGAQIFLRGDAIRLLNVAIVDPGCDVGIDVDREFMVGSLRAIGAYWAATECPALPDGTAGLPDTRGWFAITRQNEVNFAFYIYTEPAEAMDGAAKDELQAIMDSIEFDFSLLSPATPSEDE